MKYGPDTEFDCNFCAGIGPVQLGVVLVWVLICWDPYGKQYSLCCEIVLISMNVHCDI